MQTFQYDHTGFCDMFVALCLLFIPSNTFSSKNNCLRRDDACKRISQYIVTVILLTDRVYRKTHLVLDNHKMYHLPTLYLLSLQRQNLEVQRLETSF